MDKKKIWVLIAFFIPLVAACLIAGLYAGGWVFLKLAHLPKPFLSVSVLFDAVHQFAHFPAVLRLVYLGFALTALITLIPCVLLGVVLCRLRQQVSLHGDARFANDMELAESGLFPSGNASQQQKYPDVLLGKMSKGRFKGQFLRFFGQQFVALAAPTRSGKGVGVVIPNLLYYRDSVVVLDIKRENFEKTGGFRQKCGQPVFLFAPDGYSCNQSEQAQGIVRSHRWNPLSYIRRNPLYRDADVMKIAKILYPNTGSENDFWNEQAANLFKGLVLYLLDQENLPMALSVTMANVLRLTAPEGGLAAWMKAEMAAAVALSRPLSGKCVAEFNRFVAMNDKTSSNVLTNMMAPLSVFSEAICAAATSGDDFDLREVRRQRMSIYLGITPNNLPNYDRLINLFFSQLISLNTETLPAQDPSLTVQCLMMLDEFAAMGKINIVAKSISYTADYNLRYFLIFQSQAQLEKRELYGREGTKDILDNCAVKLVFPPKEVDEQAKSYSETLGYKTVKVHSRGRSHGQHTSHSDNVSEQKRALLMPQEIVDLGKKGHKHGVAIKEIVLMEKVRTFIPDKIIYFDEPVFKQRKEYSDANRIQVPILNITSA